MRASVRTAATLLLGQGLGRGAQALYGVLMVRHLSERDYGDFAYVLALAGTLVVVADLGFSRLIIKDLARSDNTEQLVLEMLRVRAFGVVGVGAVFLIVCLTGVLPQNAGLGLAACIFLLAEGFAYGYESGAIGSERSGRFAIVQGLGGLAVGAAAIVVLAQDNVTPSGAMAGLAIASVAKLAAHRMVWRARSRASRPLSDLPVRGWFRDALPFLLLGLLGAVYYRAGIVILHLLKGAEETAAFAAAMRVFDGSAVLGGVGFAAASPLVSRLHRDRPRDVWRAWRRMIAAAAAVAVPSAVLLVVTAKPLAGWLFGPRYADSAGALLAILAPGMALVVLQGLSASIVLMSDDRRDVLVLTAVNVTALLVVLVVLTATEGATGTAIGITAAEALSFGSFAILVRRRHLHCDPG